MAIPKKRTPTVFLVFVLMLVSYGFIANYLVSKLPIESSLLQNLNSINITITIFWLMFNIFLVFFFFNNNYEKEAKVLAIYYVLINSWNMSNIIFHYMTNYKVLLAISLVTKCIEVYIVLNLLIRNLRSRDYHTKF